MTSDEHELLKTIWTSVAKHIRDAHMVLMREHERFDNMPPGLTEVKLDQRIKRLATAIDGLEQAHGELMMIVNDKPDRAPGKADPHQP